MCSVSWVGGGLPPSDPLLTNILSLATCTCTSLPCQAGFFLKFILLVFGQCKSRLRPIAESVVTLN